MSRLLPTLTLLAWLGGSDPSVADEPAARRASRVIEGRILDTQGKPPRDGRILFGPLNPPIPFTEIGRASCRERV